MHRVYAAVLPARGQIRCWYLYLTLQPHQLFILTERGCSVQEEQDLVCPGVWQALKLGQWQ